MKKKWLSVLLVFAVVSTTGIFAGGSKEAGTSAKSNVNLVMGTAATSGTYYFVGAAIGDTVTQKSGKKITVDVQSTAGGIQNITLVTHGDIDIGMANSDALYDAYHGVNSFASTGKRPVLGLMALYPSVSHMIVRADSSIQSYRDLRGKKISLGTQGSSHPIASRSLLEFYGIDWEKDIRSFYLTTDEVGTKLADKDIDAGFLIGGAPLPGITNAAVTTALRFLDIDQEAIDALMKKYPYFTQAVLPKGTYKGIDYDTKAVSLMTNFFVNAKMPDEVAYEFVKTAMENLEAFKDANSSCAYIIPETVWKMGVPLHPGAERYYKEKGWIK